MSTCSVVNPLPMTTIATLSQRSGVHARGLVKTFATPQGPVRAVRGIDLDIAPGETVALLGPNGAGKTTTIDMLLGLSRPDRGDVSLFGMPPTDAVRAGLIGAMPQTGGLIRDLSVRELVAMMASLYPRPFDVDAVIALAGLRAVADQRTQKLSGGQTQRARFAVALAGDPGLLVLDEPTAALDVEGRRAFWVTMRGFASRGKTVLFATHYLEEADANADRVILLASGRVVADGPPTEIKARVGSRTIKATLPEASISDLTRLPGVTTAACDGEAVILICSDSDAAIPRAAGKSPEGPRHRNHRSRPGGSVRAAHGGGDSDEDGTADGSPDEPKKPSRMNTLSATADDSRQAQGQLPAL